MAKPTRQELEDALDRVVDILSDLGVIEEADEEDEEDDGTEGT